MARISRTRHFNIRRGASSFGLSTATIAATRVARVARRVTALLAAVHRVSLFQLRAA